VGVPALIAAMATGIAVWTLRPVVRLGGSGIARMTVALRADEQVASPTGGAITLSPDGTQLVYVGIRGSNPEQLYVRALDSLEAKPLSSTESATAPFFSPDGRWIGFFAESKLKKVSVTGAFLQTLCDAPAGKGGSWGPDDMIYFAPFNGSGLWRISASGGTCEEVTKLDRGKGEISHRWPQVLPGGQAVLFTAWTGPAPDEKHLQLLRLGTGERHVLVQSASTGRYIPSGHLVYSRNEALIAVPFDLARAEVTGPPVALEEFVQERIEGAQYAVSDFGTLAYLPGNPQWDLQRLVWVDGNGDIEPIPAPPRAYTTPVVISPDGQYAAVPITGSTIRIWSYDFSRATLTPLTSGPTSQVPVWTPDGKRIVYRGTRTGFRNLFWKAADGSGEEERLTTSQNPQTPGSFSPDGKWLAYHENSSTTGYDIWVLALDGDRKPQVFLKTPFNEGVPRFSPDDRWLAYMSTESGRPEIYVRPFPVSAGKWPISTEGGNEPIWSRDGRKLYYVNGEKMMAVDITTQPVFKAGLPRFLYEGRFESG
jgi:eukaryotic-like serine/threonine-protein kinase